MGLKFGVHVQLEANNEAHDEPDGKSRDDTEIDESFAFMSGDFGPIETGQRDAIHARTHYGINDVGIGLVAGDTQDWLGNSHCINTYGSFTDDVGVTYITPRMEGVQLGFSYTPNSRADQAANNQAPNNDMDVVGLAMNYKGGVGESSVAVSVGHLISATDSGEDDATKTNFGLNVGMGAFSFDVAYAVSDGAATTGGNTDVVAAGMMYSDGPMSVSLGQTVSEADDGDEQTATLLSASYSLAPGIAWRSSLFAAERDRGMTDANAGASVEGNGFVTGITIGF